eukprot:CAMPEP_0179355224 /NCGR_PEP_ID=MMETSP0797-20121207/77267_1 /TAXON_ID=47934 /ORGANISM="Dinophysis acuminata, Strain DAEP01" /LENGTH=328 /DNA_ID=CAMNT_0021070373 /DNA_START=168 /DNA_END=1154 /DNA_ORIENTATION=-
MRVVMLPVIRSRRGPAPPDPHALQATLELGGVATLEPVAVHPSWEHPVPEAGERHYLVPVVDHAVQVGQRRRVREGALGHHEDVRTREMRQRLNQVLVVEVDLHAAVPIPVEVGRLPDSLRRAEDVDVRGGQQPLDLLHDLEVEGVLGHQGVAVLQVATPQVQRHRGPVRRKLDLPRSQRAFEDFLEVGGEVRRGRCQDFVLHQRDEDVDILRQPDVLQETLDLPIATELLQVESRPDRRVEQELRGRALAEVVVHNLAELVAVGAHGRLYGVVHVPEDPAEIHPVLLGEGQAVDHVDEAVTAAVGELADVQPGGLRPVEVADRQTAE